MRFILFCYSLLTSSSLLAQEISIKSQNKGASNTLYSAEDNLIQILNIPNGVKVKLVAGSVTELEQGQYSFKEKCCLTPTYDTLIISKGREILYKKSFRVVYRGAPYISIGDVGCSDSVVAKTFLEYQQIKIRPDSLHLKVVSFELSIRPVHGEVLGPLTSNAEMFTMQQIEALRRLKKDDVLFFDNVICKSINSGIVSKLNAVMYVSESTPLGDDFMPMNRLNRRVR